MYFDFVLLCIIFELAAAFSYRTWFYIFASMPVMCYIPIPVAWGLGMRLWPPTIQAWTKFLLHKLEVHGHNILATWSSEDYLHDVKFMHASWWSVPALTRLLRLKTKLYQLLTFSISPHSFELSQLKQNASNSRQTFTAEAKCFKLTSNFNSMIVVKHILKFKNTKII